jgi:hypothetical protein
MPGAVVLFGNPPKNGLSSEREAWGEVKKLASALPHSPNAQRLAALSTAMLKQLYKGVHVNPAEPISESNAWYQVIEVAHAQGLTSLENLGRLMLGQVRGDVHTNPARKGEKFSNHVQAVVYRHVTEGHRVHGFGNAEIGLKSHGHTLTISNLPERTDVEMYALEDGSILLKHRSGKPLWEKMR